MTATRLSEAPTKDDLAALAFSVLSTRCADVVNRRLSMSERARLREGLARVRDASDADRLAAVRVLAGAVRDGIDWPVPSSHDDADCPFNPVAHYPRYAVAEVLDRMMQREPIQAVVTLCHLDPKVRTDIWDRMLPESRTIIIPRLNEVHLVSVTRTKEYAKDINARLTRTMRALARNQR